MNKYFTIPFTLLLVVTVTDARRTLYNNDEPTPEDLFGLLGIFPTFCESKIGQKFTKCLTDPPVAAPTQMMSGGKGAPTPGTMMGKRERRQHRRTTTTVEEKYNEDILEAFNALTSDEKKRLLLAIEQDDIKIIDTIFDTTNNEQEPHHGRHLYVSNNIDNEPTPEDLFGLLGIFPTFCESKIGQKFTKCLTDPPVAAPTQMMSGGKGAPTPGTMMGKRHRHRMVQEKEVEYYDSNDLLVAYNALSSKDKKRLIDAIENDNVEAIDEILLVNMI